MARDVVTCEEALTVLTSGYEPSMLESLEELEVAVAWVDDAEPLVRARVLEAAEQLPRRRSVRLPRPEGVHPVFDREVADVHRELFAENADLYGEDVRLKIERCLEVSEADAERAARRRAEYLEEVESALVGFDLVLTPTLPRVAPRIGEGAPGDLKVRKSLIANTFPFNALGWPALALPYGTGEDGLPASVQLVGHAGADALVLGAGRVLEAAFVQ
jgi:aspartyl-tRNA(Asn)/glutamyl-tRNA(Gln) amidotransferase subunit A